MKTHELAKALNILSRLLKSGPNIEISQAAMIDKKHYHGRYEDDSKTALIGLSVLANLSQIDKKKWIYLIEENEFPIDVRPRDASRDLIGKILKHLEQNPKARKSIQEKANKKSPSASPELTKALSLLIND